MDSWLLAHEPELEGAIHVFVDINQKYVDKEMRSAMMLAEELNATFEYVEGPDLGQYEHSTGIIPFRNAQMIMLAALYGQEIYFGVIADEINSDKSVEFVDAIRSVLNISHRAQYWTHGKNYNILTPFRDTTKSDLVRRFIANGGSMEKLLTSVSCYDAHDQHCGRCASCSKRWIALVNALGVDNWKAWGFAQHPYTWKTSVEWWASCKNYSVNRSNEVLSALKIAEACL